MAATIVATPQHAFHNAPVQSSPAFMDSFTDPWRSALQRSHSSAAANNNNTSQAAFGNTTTSGSHLMRTDVFPQFSDAADCSPRSSSTTSSSPSSYLGHYGTTPNGGTTQVSNSTTSVSSGMDHSDDHADGHLDFSATFSATLPSAATPGVEWSTTGLPSISSTDLPSQSLLQMHRDDSLIGKSIGFEALSSEIDAAPAAAAPVKTPQPADLFGSQPLAFDMSSLTSPDSTSTDLGYNFDLATPGLTTIIGAIPTTHHAITPSTTGGYLPSTETVDDEPDASSVSDVDAASDAWSEISDPKSPITPAVAPLSPISSIVRVAPIAPGTTAVNPNAALALRPGPYTRGRAAALAAPAARELKPVPVARGPHAGLLGGGEMATVGIYTKDDRWRKIERLREKRRARIVVKSSGGQYACRKSFADRRPRVGGRFVKMDEETKRYLSLTKPGTSTPSNLPTPAALVAYAHQQQESAARAAAAAAAAAAHPPASSSSARGHHEVPATHYNSQLAVAAHAASTASPMMPLFGSNTTSLPPAPSFPAPPVNTTSGGLWFGSDYTTSA